ncbi:MAG TPA: sigma-70 family RNA polymerase sigma factor [Verrucomicrobiae bacterium]|nr:sigma-70 family RNA polymerase sigma factor [Verrucomicrobiae bacterium]
MMTMMDSHELLAEYATTGSEAAFRELVASYLDLVYSAAVRLVDGDSHRAEDVAQTVFIDLARRAHALSNEVMLGGWLHRHTCFVAANLMRAERRRQSRERQAVEMNALQDHPEASAAAIAPLLDDAINELGDSDRTAILLRFFEQRDFRSVGEALGSNEDAARMRVTRALEKLRSVLKARGVTTTAAALGVVLTASAIHAAPVGLASTISTAVAVAKTTLAATSGAVIKTIAMTTLQKTLITAVIAVAVGVAIYEARQTANLRAQVEALQRERNSALHQLASVSARPGPRLPAPPVQIIVQTNAAPVEELPLTNLYARIKDKATVLTAEQVAAYLQANHTNASTLLAAYRTSRDVATLKEAMEKYPNDPRVDFEALMAMAVNRLPSDDRQQWLSNFEKNAPDNALGYYLSAQNDLQSGLSDKALQELAAAAGKPFDDYTADRIQNDQEAYLAAGYPLAEATTIASMGEILPQLAPMKQLAQNLISLANAYSQSGDTASAQAVLQTALNLGENVGGGSANPVLISQLVGDAVETMALTNMNPTSLYGDSGQTVQDYLNQIKQQRAAIRDMDQQVQTLMPMLSDQDIMTYENRRSLFGEVAAMQWVLNKYGQPSP